MGTFLKNLRKNRKYKLSAKEQLRFIKRLYRLLNNGYSLIRALKMIQYDQDLKESAIIIEQKLIKGLTIDEAFEKAHFDQTITSYLYFIRINGDLETSFKKCIEMFEQKITYTNKLLRIIRYPLILTIIFVILLIVIKRTVLPSFLDLFQTSEQASSLVIHFILIIDYLTTLFFGFLFLTLCLFISWHFIKKRLTIETQLKIYNRIPFLRTALTVQTTFLLATHMSMLLKTGMPLKKVLKKLATQQKLPVIAYYSSLMRNELINGLHFINLLRHLPFIDRPFANLFQKTNDQFQLEKDLSTYANILAEEIEQKIMRLIHIVQPTFFIILGCFIILIYGTLMWPMLELIQSI